MPDRRLFQLLVFLLLSLAAPAATAAAPSSEDAAVLAGYRQFHNADLAGAQQTFEKLLAGEPRNLAGQFGLLQVLEQRSQQEKQLEPEFERRIEALLNEAEARFARSDKDDEALFHLANGYMLRATYRYNRDKGMWGAARDGARAKRFSDQYVQRHPEHGDAYLTLGTYNYYAEIVPAFFKVMRVFLFLPAGNRALGLQQIERAYAQGNLFVPQAGITLIEIYSAFESRPADGVRIGERLSAQFPDNPKILFTLAELYESPAVEDHERAATTYERIIKYEDARERERPAKYQARLGLAAARMSRWRADEAFAVLDDVIARKPAEPLWVMPNFLLRRANYRGLANQPTADDDVKAVLAESRWKEWHKQANDRLAWLQRRRSSGEAAVYAALIPGNRFTALRRWNEASASYEQVRAQHPNNPQVRFRMAQLAFLRGDEERSLPEFTGLSDAAVAPNWIKAFSILYAARAHDLAGRRAEALALYRRVVDRYEGEGAAWAAKVGLVTPYRRPQS
jgi:hypothetical protein